MKITQEMILRRALQKLEEERNEEMKSMEKWTDIHMKEIIIMRNKKTMYIAELDQMIRNVREKLERAEAGA